MDPAFGMATGTERSKDDSAFTVENGFCQDGTGRIAGTEEQDVK